MNLNSDFNIVSKPKSISEDNENNREFKSLNLSEDSESIMNKINKTDSDYNGLKMFSPEFIKDKLNEINTGNHNSFENEDKINNFFSKSDYPSNKENYLRITDEKDQDFIFKWGFSPEHSGEDSNGFLSPHITNVFKSEKSNNNYFPNINLTSLDNRTLNSNNNFQNSQNTENKNIKNVPDYIELKKFNRKSHNAQTNKNNDNGKKKEKNQIKSISKIHDENKDKFNILKEKNIFSEKDLVEIEKNGKIYNNIIKIETESEAKNEIDIKKFQPDFMISKLKTYAKNESLKAINSFDEMEYKIKTLKTGNNYLENIGKYFNLTYLEQPLYAVLSNDSSLVDEKSNFEKIQYVINKYNHDKQITPLIEHLFLTVQDIIDILTYKKDDKDNMYKEKIFDYAAKEYEKFKIDEEKAKEFGEDSEFLKKDYIASLIFLAFNFKEYFLNKKARTIKERKPQKRKNKKE